MHKQYVGMETERSKGIGRLLWSIFIMLLFIVICWVFVDDIDGLIAGLFVKIGIEPSEVYDIIEEHFVLNLLLSLGVVGAFVELCYGIYRDRHFSFIRATLSICTIILFCLQTKWVFVPTVLRPLRYNVLISVGIFVFLFFSLRGVYLGIKTRKKNEDNSKRKSKILSLYSDTEGKKEISESRKQYALQLTNRLLKTDVSREAYAVGIEGEWGSGKSLFLEEIKKDIGDKAIVVDFNPWNSKGEEHLIKDFFSTLTHVLSPFYGGISSPVSRYVSLLYSMKVNVTGSMSLQLSPNKREKDLAERKKDIERALDKIGKHIAVFIDDIDRLNGKEIFEVLRLIRNTAVFRSTYYVVAYDKKYVVEQLGHLNIGDGGDYLEKIFQISVQIPKPDERMLIEEFKDACRTMSISPPFHNSLLVRLTDDDYHQMIKILPSYRKVKRFARQFAFNADYMRDHLTEGEFELQDLFFLNLIEYNNGDLYRQIWQAPDSLFDVKQHPSNKVRYYSWPKQGEQKERLNLSADCIFLLKRLFGVTPGANSSSIQYVDRFYKYFYIAQPEKELSSVEFEDMLNKSTSPNARAGMRATINTWVASKDSKSFDSIYSYFVNYSTNKKTSQECKNYLKAAFYWLKLEVRDYKRLKDLLPSILSAKHYQAGMRTEIMQYANSQLKILVEGKHFHSIALVLSELIRRLDAKEKLLLDKKDVEVALTRCMELFFKSNHWDPILLFRDDGNQMRLVVENCCVPLASQNNKRINLVINQVINYYSQEKNKSQSYKPADEVRSKLSNYEKSPQQSGLPDLAPIFGDDISLATKLLDECFVPSPKQ